MYICLCKGITDTQIKQAVINGSSSIKQVRRELGVASQCCKCLPEARAIINEQLDRLQDECSVNVAMPNALFFPA